MFRVKYSEWLNVQSNNGTFNFKLQRMVMEFADVCGFMWVKMAELSQAMVTYELGSAMSVADHYNIREVYTSADQYTPVIFILPTELQGPAWDATQGGSQHKVALCWKRELVGKKKRSPGAVFSFRPSFV